MKKALNSPADSARRRVDYKGADISANTCAAFASRLVATKLFRAARRVRSFLEDFDTAERAVSLPS